MGAVVENASLSGPLSSEFGPFHGRIWMNCAHQGPLPRPAQLAALEALELKTAPARIPDSLFAEVPERLRSALAQLVGGRPQEIALTNSTSYGFNLLAQGLPWQEGDEIICVSGDFPATVVPWLPLERRGVQIRLLEAPDARVTPEQLAAEIGSQTRAVCMSWVFSFFGHAIDLEAFGQVCRERDVLFFVNGSQAIGARPLDVSRLPVDAVSGCGFKWLCGPYATGFVWLSPQIIERIDYPQPHWLRLQLKEAATAGVDLNRELDYSLPDETTADAHDVFCAANFLNCMPWTASIEHFLELGLERIEEHDQALVERFVVGLSSRYRLVSPREREQRSTLVLVTHEEKERNADIHAALQLRGIDIALRDDKLRFSPHLHNSGDDIDHALEVLADLA
jgi:cysteine desulfurase / selenocysteine lyase